VTAGDGGGTDADRLAQPARTTIAITTSPTRVDIGQDITDPRS